MGYMIHFDEDTIGEDELKLIETKQAILEKLRVRYGFGDMSNPPVLATAQMAPANGLPHTHAPQLL